MQKITFKKLIPFLYITTSVLVGLILLVYTFFFPDVDLYHKSFLYYATLPAFMAGFYLGGETNWFVVYATLAQIIIFSSFGFALYLVHTAVTRLLKYLFAK